MLRSGIGISIGISISGSSSSRRFRGAPYALASTTGTYTTANAVSKQHLCRVLATSYEHAIRAQHWGHSTEI